MMIEEQKDDSGFVSLPFGKQTVGCCLSQPIAICDGDAGGYFEDKLEKYFEANRIAFEKCYSLYKKTTDLSKYETICFYTTNAYPKKVEAIMNFKFDNLKAVVVMGEYAYDIASPICQKLNIQLFAFCHLENKIIEAAEYFGY